MSACPSLYSRSRCISLSTRSSLSPTCLLHTSSRRHGASALGAGSVPYRHHCRRLLHGHMRRTPLNGNNDMRRHMHSGGTTWANLSSMLNRLMSKKAIQQERDGDGQRSNAKRMRKRNSKGGDMASSACHSAVEGEKDEGGDSNSAGEKEAHLQHGGEESSASLPHFEALNPEAVYKGIFHPDSIVNRSHRNNSNAEVVREAGAALEKDVPFMCEMVEKLVEQDDNEYFEDDYYDNDDGEGAGEDGGYGGMPTATDKELETGQSEFSYFNSVKFDPEELKKFNGMRLAFLGTSSNKPTKFRNVSGIALQLNGETWIFDCGEGTQHQLVHYPVLRTGDISRIFVTHMHGDHVLGLPGMLMDLLHMNPLRKTNVRFVYGPQGIHNFITSIFDHTHCKMRRIHITELAPPRKTGSPPVSMGKMHRAMLPNADGVYKLFEDAGFLVQTKLIKHSVRCYGYVITEKDKPGRIDVEKATQLGLKPGPEYKDLKMGKDVTLPDGRIICARDVVGEPHKGRKIVILGDTYDPYSLVDLAMDADVVVHEATLPDGLQQTAISRGHSTPSMAGRFARAINAKQLIITHFGGRYARDMEFVEDIMVRQAREAFGNDNVIAARDHMFLDIPMHDKSSMSQEEQETKEEKHEIMQ